MALTAETWAGMQVMLKMKNWCWRQEKPAPQVHSANTGHPPSSRRWGWHWQGKTQGSDIDLGQKELGEGGWWGTYRNLCTIYREESKRRSMGFIYSSLQLFVQSLWHCLYCSRYKDKWNWSLPREVTIQTPNLSHPGSFLKYSSPCPQPRHSDSESLKVMLKRPKSPILDAFQVSVLVWWDNKWRGPRRGTARDGKTSWFTSSRKPSLISPAHWSTCPL